MATILRRITGALTVVTLAGLVAVALIGAPLALLPATILGALVGVVVYVVVIPVATPTAAQRTATRALASRVGAAVGVVVLALGGLAVLLGGAAGPLILFGALSVTACSRSRARRALTRYRDRWGVRPVPATRVQEPVDVVTAPPHHGKPLVSFGTAALCATWHRTYHHLGEVRDEASRDALLDLRRRCLDEFERRDPAGTAQWLATESRPAGTSPLRHLHQPAPPPSPPPSEGCSGDDPAGPPAPSAPPV